MGLHLPWRSVVSFWDHLFEAGEFGLAPMFRRKKPSRKTVRKRSYWPTFEFLERRELPAVLTGITEYAITTGSSGPKGITAGPDGNVWFVENSTNKVAKITPSGTITEYTIPTSNSQPYDIVAGPDGLLWFTEANANKIGKVTTSGTITEYTITTSASVPHGITVGPDGLLWFVENSGNNVAKITTSGTITEYSIPTSSSLPEEIVAGPDGNLWFTESLVNFIADKIAKVTTSGTITEYTVPTRFAGPFGITSDSSIWFTENNGNKIGRATISGAITEFGIPTMGASAKGITIGPDGNIWFVESGTDKIGRLTPLGDFTEYTVPTSSASLEGICVGGDGNLWVTAPGTNKIIKYAWIQQGETQADDPTTAQAVAEFSTNVANLHVEAPVALLPHMTITGPVLDPSNAGDWVRLVYNSTATPYKPIIETVYYSDVSGSVPDQLDVRFKWNGGSWSSWTTFGTSGHPAGDDYLLSMQVASNVTATGYYPWEVEVKATFGADTLTRNLTGKTLVVIQDDTTSPFGQGWYVSGLDQLVSVTGGVVWVHGAGGGRFFESVSGSDYISPRLDFGSLVKNGGGDYTYTAKDQVQTNFDSSGLITSIVQPAGFLTTYAYSSGRVSTITTPDGVVVTFTYNASNRLEKITSPGSAVVTVTQDATTKDLTKLEFADGSLRTFTYDSGHKVTNEKWGSLNTTYAYDANNGTLSTLTYSATSSVGVSPYAEQGLTTSNAVSLSSAAGVSVDPLGNRTTVMYNRYGQPTQIQVADGGRTTFVYDTYGQVTQQIDPLGRTTQFEYAYGNSKGDLKKITAPDGTIQQFEYDSTFHKPTVLIDQFANRTTLTYNATTGNLETTVDFLANRVTNTYYTSGNGNGLLQSILDPYGNRTTFNYDSNHRLSTSIDFLGNTATIAYDSYGNPNAITNIYGKTATTVYDALHRPTTLIDVLSNRTTLAYNAQGQVTSKIDVLSNRTTFVYDNQGRLETVIDVLGGRTTNIYDAASHLTATVDPLANRTSFTYDGVGRQTSIQNALGKRVTTVYNLAGQVSAIVDPLANRTTTLYDAYGRLETLQDALGNRTTTIYNVNGQVSAIVNALAGRTTAVYDSYGRAETTIDALGRRTTTVYDSNGRVSAVVDALANRTTELYDSRGRPEAIQNPLGNRVTTVYDGYGRVQATIDSLGNRTTTTFDVYGRAEATINPLGKRVTAVYDSYGRVSATVDQLADRTTTAYDAYGRQQNLIDPVNNKTTFVYDALNRVIQEIDPLGKSTTMAYDAAGRLSSRTDRIGRRREFSYDDAGRQIGEQWISWPSAIETNRLTFTYDAVGNLLTGRDYDGAYTMTYDALHRVTTVNDVWGKRLTFTYDAVGNRTQVLDSAGGTTDSTFDSLNRLTNRKYSESGSVQLSVTQVYDAASRMTEQWRYGTSYSLVARTSLAYDAANRMTNLQHRDGSGNNIANYTYTYDAQTRLTSEVRNGTTVTYTYDDTDQLTADGTVTVTYDANGNRNNGSYTTGTGNRMSSDGTWTYTYDDEGNTIKKSKGASAETWVYVYDEKNELVTVKRSQTDGGTVDRQVDFKYDVFGNRIEKSYDPDGAGGTGATVTRFTYDGWKNTHAPLIGNENWDVWADLDGGSSLTTRYIRGDAIDQIFSRIDSGTNYWELTDRLGSVRDVINNSAVIKDTIGYNGFGGITTETDSSFRGRYAWTAREVESEINVQYNRARYYDAATGRWINQDPLGYDAGDSNLYRYAMNKPVQFLDPSGYQLSRPGSPLMDPPGKPPPWIDNTIMGPQQPKQSEPVIKFPGMKTWPDNTIMGPQKPKKSEPVIEFPGMKPWPDETLDGGPKANKPAGKPFRDLPLMDPLPWSLPPKQPQGPSISGYSPYQGQQMLEDRLRFMESFPGAFKPQDWKEILDALGQHGGHGGHGGHNPHVPEKEGWPALIPKPGNMGPDLILPPPWGNLPPRVRPVK